MKKAIYLLLFAIFIFWVIATILIYSGAVKIPSEYYPALEAGNTAAYTGDILPSDQFVIGLGSSVETDVIFSVSCASMQNDVCVPDEIIIRKDYVASFTDSIDEYIFEIDLSNQGE